MKQKIEIALEMHVLIFINSCKLHSYEKKCSFFFLFHPTPDTHTQKKKSERFKDQVYITYLLSKLRSIMNRHRHSAAFLKTPNELLLCVGTELLSNTV